MKKLVLCLFGLMMSTSVFAATGWTGQRNIVSLETHASGTEIRLEGFGGACSQIVEGGVTLTVTIIRNTSQNKEQLMAVLMTAFATGKPVDIYCSDPAQGAPVDHIVLKR